MDPALSTLQSLQSQVDNEDWHAIINECSDLIPQHPSSSVLWNIFGLGHLRVGNFSGAKMAFAEAISVKPDFSAAHFNLANVFRELGANEEAVEAYKTCIGLEPRNAQYQNNLGNLLIKLRQPEDALVYLMNAAKLAPEVAIYQFNIANLFKSLAQHVDAEFFYKRAIEIEPKNPDFRTNYITFLEDVGAISEAKQQVKIGLNFSPNSPELKAKLGYIRLREQQFQIGWELRNQYWKIRQPAEPFLKTQKPLWEGEKTGHLFVWAEQGIGDEIMVSTCFEEMRSRCEKLTISASDRLLPIFERSFSKNIDFISRLTTPSDAKFDAHAPGMTALGLLRPDAKSFQNNSVNNFRLLADGYKTAEFRSQALANDNERPVIGISWFSKSARNGSYRSIPLSQLMSVLPKGAVLVNLQYGDFESDFENLASEFGHVALSFKAVDKWTDLEGLASLIDACDEVVTIDNSIVHFAGAMGKKCNLLLPVGADWRWGRKDEKSSYWYSSIRINRQAVLGNWDSCLANLALFSTSKLT